MRNPLYLGIDVGTYESKGVLTDRHGKVHSQAFVKHEMLVPKPGWAEHDPMDVWWGDFVRITKALLGQTGISSKRIASVAVSAIGPCMLPIDEQCNPLYSGVLYGVDTRASEEINYLNDLIGSEPIFDFGGNALTSQSIGPKILWLKREHPDIYKKMHKIVTSTTFIVQKLTDRCVIDHYSAANFTPFYNKSKLKWSDSLAPNLIDIRKLPELKWTTDIAGFISEKASRETGLASGVPVTVGTIDAAAEAISVGVQKPGHMMIMYGSTMFFIGLTSKDQSDQSLWSAPWLFKNEFSLMAGTSTSGTITQWFRKEFARELDHSEAFTELIKLASHSPIGSKNLITLPYFSGERTPIQNPNASGVIFGLNLTHTRADIYRSILEGISYGANHIIETFVSAGFKPKTIFAVGGGVKNEIWTSSISNTSGFDQIIKSKTLGAAYGNSFLGALSLGHVERKEIDNWNETKRVIKAEINPIYLKQYKLFKALYQSTSGLMQ
jgi:xylulokinase